ncbi:hypothetical protein R3P38DRAFT_2822518 [Favolaschia claudopus]|uniref:Uncharacterized protein n=1 Tax=Favolaschia claudopus TaxID=2862362 RepID=A0AAW0EID8_9AGAR
MDSQHISFRDSAILALSNISPPSPILNAIGISCSSDSIPILFDLDVDFDDLEIIQDHRGSVGTFGPLHRQSIQSNSCRSPLTPTFPREPYGPAVCDSSSHGSPNSVTPSCTPALSPTRAALTCIQNIEAPQIASTLQTTSSSSLAHLLSSTSINTCPPSTSSWRKFDFSIHNGQSLSASRSWIPALRPRNKESVQDVQNRLSAPVPQRPSEIRANLVRQPHIRSSNLSKAEPIPIPQHLTWLEGTVIELLVDQEAFRSIHPTFRLVGFPKQARGWDSSDGALALFRPIKRESFRFHYAPFDSDFPIIRRLSINGDETRDYLSRQAYLSLKTNGVYTVQGMESSHLHLPSSSFESGDVKLKWRFEYLVEDLYHSESGRIIDGEKTLTPISFLCSPYLLHQSQGRKMKFMHFVKKSVTTKLVAEKLEPPCRFGPPPSRQNPVPNMWTLHRRVQSSYEEELKSKKKTGSLRHTEEDHLSAKTPRGETQVSRRRRASSAGEERRTPMAVALQNYGFPSQVLTSENEFPRHILPREQLVELFDNDHPGGEGPNNLHGLTPAPRRT